MLIRQIGDKKSSHSNHIHGPLIVLTQILILIIKMCQTTPQLTEAQTAQIQLIRFKHINSFFQIKEKLKILSRQTLFLGIAICDKFFELTDHSPQILTSLQESATLRVIACIWVAWKFIETDKIPVKKLLQKVHHSITSQDIIEMEFEILQKIDFEIPSATAYSSMTVEFCALQSDRRNQITLAGKCLKFLQEALKLSSDFSLCSELGPKIVRLYRERSLQDSRIRTAYMHIQNKSSQKLADGIGAH